LDPSADRGDGNLNGVAFSQAFVSKVVVCFTNGTTRFIGCGTDHNSPFFSCSGVPQDDSASADYKIALTPN